MVHSQLIGPAYNWPMNIEIPNNGGLQCEGAAIRGILCSTHYSTCQGLSRKEYTNKICSSIKFDPAKPDQQLTGDGFEHSTQPCRVWCHLIGSELIRNKGQFPDGTPCGLDQFCISGICLKLGCDSKALVAGEDDCPDKNPRKRWSDWYARCLAVGPDVKFLRRSSWANFGVEIANYDLVEGMIFSNANLFL
ncbi:hypothetical protein NECAME_05840 [Necator americanus]|uniref:Adt-1/2-like domain-containing protein n=1 Tax=Necator americanus TaxID=51031 RepID=W2U0E1_NECAM|nr:hypothetical protein NECAME_05840 [Necator americanus]ETN86752.1 hypothetical protein NECAME_05840 [Necator americanus]